MENKENDVAVLREQIARLSSDLEGKNKIIAEMKGYEAVEKGKVIESLTAVFNMIVGRIEKQAKLLDLSPRFARDPNLLVISKR